MKFDATCIELYAGPLDGTRIPNSDINTIRVPLEPLVQDHNALPNPAVLAKMPYHLYVRSEMHRFVDEPTLGGMVIILRCIRFDYCGVVTP